MGNLIIRALPVGQLQTNCYLVFDRQKEEGIIIDPGDDAGYITQIIADEKIKPLEILATHGHFDHLLGATELKLAYQIPFLIHKKDAFLIKNMQKSAEHFLGTHPDPPPPIDGFLKEGQKISFGRYHLEVLETPGHTPGGICFRLAEKDVLFCGDTVFKEGVGRTDFSYSSTGDLEKSLQKIFAFPQKTTLYPGHGSKTDVKSEKKNSILRRF